ncbi:MAG: M3 family metallopeptidase [Pseudomonadota bacterium]|nr:M3 family metallopeptidase [Pseudomonadota bacterium]
MGDNPLLGRWTTRFGEPPFSQVRLEHFRPAFDAGVAEWRAEREAIKAAPASFAATILGLERAGQTLDRVERVFSHLVGTASSDEIEAIQREIQPRLAREYADMLLDDALFARVEAVYEQRDGLDAEARRLVERRRLAFKRAGAGLPEASKQRLAAIAERLAALGAAFGQNVLGDEKAFTLVLDAEADLAGLPPAEVAAASAAAQERGHAGKWVVTLSRSSVEPFLQFSARRDLREKVWRAFVARGAGGAERDNGAVMSEIVALRVELAQLLGYPTFADYKLADTMAGKPGAALDLLRRVWTPARAAANEEAKALQAMIAAEGGNFELKPWDWRYYAEKRRQALYDFDESAIRAHLPLDNVLAAAFAVAGRLFGLTFEERRDVELPHPDARAFEVKDKAGRHVALFIGDFFARPDKHSGAWMSALRDQHRLDGDHTPIVVNVLNAARGGEGAPTLLSHDEARTLFHEFGHGLHGMLSDVTYPYLSGTNVARDFVELPSQLYEHWLDRPEVLSQFASHHATGAPIPDELIARMTRARAYGQAHTTVEFLASAFTDMKAHGLTEARAVDVRALEAAELAALEMPAAIVPRHAAPHFQHVFSGDGYSAGYYSYLWSEVLDADAFEAFVDSGDVFDPALAERLRRYIYASGGTLEPDQAYAAFRGRGPDATALLRKRGFA